MTRKNIVMSILLFFGSCATLILAYQTNGSKTRVVQASSQLSYSQPQKQNQVVFGVPIKLKIPKINVNSKVNFMGLTKDGDMEAPEGGRNVGWYKMGSRPGNNGTAVIAGHFGRWANGEGSVFDNLNKLKKGDEIYVEDDKGQMAIFVVSESRIYNPDEDVPIVFNVASDGKSYLNLITCQGNWNEGQSSYSDRLVVFADKKI